MVDLSGGIWLQAPGKGGLVSSHNPDDKACILSEEAAKRQSHTQLPVNTGRAAAPSPITLFLVVGTRFFPGVLYVAILEDYAWTRAETAGAFSMMLVVHAGFSLVVGWLFDRLGPRKLFPLGGLAIAIGFAARSQIRAVSFY